ncbi:RHS repeat-associated core domain-containing protein [Streptomyces flaveus]|uniref:RHS repeat-associated core domain-containing protein n=1 Tax=Streptomyces flaveus TaxID=66370 RepID=UPI00332A6973
MAEAARARQSTRRSGPGPARTHRRAVDATWTWDTAGPTVHPRRRERQRRKRRGQWWSAPTDSLGTAVADTGATADTFTWLLDDPNGTVEDTATSSAATGTATFDAFGEQGSTSGSYATGNPLRFQGQYLDTVTGLYDLRARDHDSGTGRFTAVDPLPPSEGTDCTDPYDFALTAPPSSAAPEASTPAAAPARTARTVSTRRRSRPRTTR